MSLPVNTIISVSVAAAQAALANYNVNSLAILSKEVPLQNYGRGATATATLTAQAISSVAVNTGGTGYTVPPPIFVIGGGGTGALLQAVLTGGVVTAINVINGGSGYTAAPTVVVGSGLNVYTSADAVAADWGTTSETYMQAVLAFSQSPNITTGGGVLAVYAMNSADTLTTALTTLLGQIYVGGAIWAGYQPNTSEITLGAELCQAQVPPVMLGNPSSLLTDLYSGGTFFALQAASLTQARGFLYTLQDVYSTPAQAARVVMAAYMSRLMGTNFEGSATTSTMNLKQLIGVTPDPNISQSIYAQCQVVGADVYTYVQNLPEVLSTGGNGYSDNVFNLQWYVGAVMVNMFNALATTSTKIPQTEAGMSVLKNAIIQVAELAVTNGFLAPGAWNGPIPFGDPETFLQNVAAQGYYLYSQPVAQQLQSSRAQRKAPLIQHSIKYAGAIQEASAVIYFQP